VTRLALAGPQNFGLDADIPGTATLSSSSSLRARTPTALPAAMPAAMPADYIVRALQKFVLNPSQGRHPKTVTSSAPASGLRSSGPFTDQTGQVNQDHPCLPLLRSRTVGRDSFHLLQQARLWIIVLRTAPFGRFFNS
jgi:hypothetical protein